MPNIYSVRQLTLVLNLKLTTQCSHDVSSIWHFVEVIKKSLHSREPQLWLQRHQLLVSPGWPPGGGRGSGSAQDIRWWRHWPGGARVCHQSDDQQAHHLPPAPTREARHFYKSESDIILVFGDCYVPCKNKFILTIFFASWIRIKRDVRWFNG